MSRRPPQVGVTFFLRRDSHSIWSNGAEQNCVFLVQLLRAAQVGKVFAINAGEETAPHPGLMLKGLDIEFVRFADVKDELDVLIEASGQVSAAEVAHVRDRGGKAVTYKFGNAFVIDTERCIHGKESGGIFNGSQFDEVWTTPQHVRTCASYWETCYRAPVKVLPHIWEPTFVDAAAAEIEPPAAFGYVPGVRKKRVGILEPNINVVKTCILPLLICEQAYRVHPGLFGDILACSALHLKGHVTFEHFVCNLDIQKAKLASFEGRFNTPFFLAKHADVVVSHQWECGLNYAYYDVLHGGYPLVHNSEFLPEGVGYRYHDFNIEEGACALLSALGTHDAMLGEYRSRANAFLETVRATNPKNVEAHRLALSQLMG